MAAKALGQVLFYSTHKVTVHQTWFQRLIGTHTEEVQLRDWRWAAGACLGVAGGYLAYRCLRPKSLKRYVDPMMTSPEGMVPGNELLDGGKLPRGQVAVAIKRGGNLCVVGGGIRVENYLLTPMHNTFSGCDLYVVVGEKEVRVDPDTELILAADVCAYKLSETAWATLGVQQAKLGPLKSSATVTATSSCDGKYSVSSLRPIEPLGRLNYYGSTQPGFSGSAYMNGNVALGMHLHGGVQGGGYELLYLYARLKLAIQQRPEDSADFMYKTAREEDFRTERLADDDEIVRMASGTYHITKTDIVSKMRKLRDSTDWADEVEYDELEDRLARQDYVPESLIPSTSFPGEGRRPAKKQKHLPAKSRSLPDSSLSVGTVVPQPEKPLPSQSPKGVDLERRLKGMESMLNKLLSQRPKPTGPRISQQQQNGQVSVSN